MERAAEIYVGSSSVHQPPFWPLLMTVSGHGMEDPNRVVAVMTRRCSMQGHLST